MGVYEQEGKLRVGLEAYHIGRNPLATGEQPRSYWLLGLMDERRWTHFSLFANAENLLNIWQGRY